MRNNILNHTCSTFTHDQHPLCSQLPQLLTFCIANLKDLLDSIVQNYLSQPYACFSLDRLLVLNLNIIESMFLCINSTRIESYLFPGSPNNPSIISIPRDILQRVLVVFKKFGELQYLSLTDGLKGSKTQVQTTCLFFKRDWEQYHQKISRSNNVRQFLWMANPRLG
ncbi:hypothetical protein AX774_g380 [Zancudomyces culisetae]|uniref:Uncharacterized protein n=1 Tax=Zancudomyces culisetae TaxID=1213189 RepID=A0A1R1PYP1_ZANCU|nr:hypothetical protein AX774_g380 [Zancudomyces culisetae]|eukprot:OMH86065.1 hypothetical protein AX774_g380 [Zancudomyces culisetae]